MTLRHRVTPNGRCRWQACLVAAALSLPAGVSAQQQPWRSENNVAAIPQAELDAITWRGRIIAEYDFAAWHASDAILALQPRAELVRGFVARQKSDGAWEVVFGRPSASADTFYIAFRAVAKERHSSAFTTYEMRPPSADVGYFARAWRALKVSVADFGPVSRPYNPMVVPTAGQEWYVYLVPAPTVAGVWPHGGDMRYRVSADGRTILERRRLHNAILDFSAGLRPDSVDLMATIRAIVLDERPEDTDVFHILTRTPRVPGLFGSKSYYFSIDLNGWIKAYNRDTTIKR